MKLAYVTRLLNARLGRNHPSHLNIMEHATGTDLEVAVFSSVGRGSSVPKQIVPRVFAFLPGVSMVFRLSVFGEIELVAEVGFFLVEHPLNGGAHAVVRLARDIELAVKAAMQVIAASGAGFGPTRETLFRYPSLTTPMAEFHDVAISPV